MAASELEIEPDLNKAPPHVEGELLKQNTKAIVGKKGWKKYFFIVLRDKLQYYKRREDYKSSKEPISFVRVSQVMDIAEVVFSGVPKKHHLNCGFSIIAFHPTTQQQQSINLLTETPEDMRYWVHALRYIKAYWSKMQVRETVLSEEQERKLLERILNEEEDERDILVGEYSLGEDSLNMEERSSSVPVYFADGSKVKLNMLPSNTTSDLLDHEKVKDKLTSSAAQLWFIDNHGNDQLLHPKDHPVLYQPKAHKLYALDPSHRILVVFYSRDQKFEPIPVSSNITAAELIGHHNISVLLDISGITNRGLFLKSSEEEQLFNSSECPCEVMFGVDDNGRIVRQPVGHLVIKNKALGGARRTQKPRFRTMYRTFRSTSEEERLMEHMSEEEVAQSKALDQIYKKKLPMNVKDTTMDVLEDEDWVVTGVPSAVHNFEPRDSLPNIKIKSGMSGTVGRNGRGFEDSVEVDSQVAARTFRISSLPTIQNTRPRSSPVVRRGSPASSRQKRPTNGVSSALAESSLTAENSNQRRLSPSNSPPQASPTRRSRSKSPRRLPDLPTMDESNEPLRRRNATKTKRFSASSSEEITVPKGPTIVHTSETSDLSPLNPTVSRNRSPSFRKSVMDIHADNSRSSAFGVTSPLHSNLKPELTSKVPSTSSNKYNPLGESDEDRLEKLFSRSYQQETEEQNRDNRPVDTLSDKYQAVLEGQKQGERGKKKEEGEGGKNEGGDAPQPMVIDFTQLLARQSFPLPPDTAPAVAPARPSAPMDVPSPSLLKVILLQSLEASTGTIESKPMDFISLSGVCLRNDHGVWRIQEGCNYHDPLAFDCEDHTETFPLPGGIRAIYNHTHKRWHVLPTSSLTPSMEESRSELDSSELTEEQDRSRPSDEATLYMTKKAITTEIGSAFHEVLEQFGCTRDLKEKERIGSDMTNVAIGHMIRGRLCSALAGLLLDGLKPYRMEGLVVDDIWKVTVAFCQEAQSSYASPLVFPAFDKQILQPIRAIKSLNNNNIKFRTFICLAMSKGMLSDWLEALPKQKDTLRKYYRPFGFLPLASQVEVFSQLYQQVLLALEPIAHLPFDLSIDFESKHAGRPNQAEPMNEQLVPPPQPTNEGSASPQLRTVVKIHAATGQKTTAGNILTAVWHTPMEVKDQTAATDETDSPSSIQALKNIQEREQARISQPPPPSSQPVNTREKQSWFKKLATSLQQLNAGGAITGPPKPSQQKRPAATKANERRVEALYNNIAEDADELSFSKGDVMIVKEQINEEWIICSHGNQTGIVPMNYVKVMP